MLTFGNTPVPFTVSWSAEERQFVARCRFADGRPALCQEHHPGEGKPLFGKPHNVRQRQAIGEGLCDLCGKPLRNRTKVSLSHATVRNNGAEGPAVMQVEPLLHRECAAICMRFCPSLRRDIQQGTLMIRQVTRFRVQIALMSPEFIHHYVPEYVKNSADRIAGHAKVELLAWKDRDEDWLHAGA
jgi:hypothetical protein